MNWLLAVLSAVNAVLFAIFIYLFLTEETKDNIDKVMIVTCIVLSVGNICGGLYQFGWLHTVYDWPGIVYIVSALIFLFCTQVILHCWDGTKDAGQACFFGFFTLANIVGATHYWYGEKIVRLFS